MRPGFAPLWVKPATGGAAIPLPAALPDALKQRVVGGPLRTVAALPEDRPKARETPRGKRVSAPYMRWYPGSYAKHTGHLTTLEHGAYRLLIDALWAAGGRLPADDRRLSRVAKMTTEEWADHREVLLEFFYRRGGHVRHRRVDDELSYALSKKLHAERAGNASASKRAQKNSELGSTRVEQASNPNPTILSSPCSTEQETKEANASSVDARARANGFHLDGNEPQPKPKSRPPTHLPADWLPGIEERAYAAKAGLTTEEIDHVGREFQNYWVGLGGKRALRSDWYRVWVNRVDVIVERRGVAPNRAVAGSGNRRNVSFVDLILQDQGKAPPG